MLTKSTFLGAFTLLSACSAVSHHVPKYIDLEHRPANIKSKYGIETITETDVSFHRGGTLHTFHWHTQRFWFGNFDIGDSENLTLLIDTGSSDVIMNSGMYKPGPRAANIHKNFTITYGTTESDGSGTGTVWTSSSETLKVI